MSSSLSYNELPGPDPINKNLVKLDIFYKIKFKGNIQAKGKFVMQSLCTIFITVASAKSTN